MTEKNLQSYMGENQPKWGLRRKYGKPFIGEWEYEPFIRPTSRDVPIVMPTKLQVSNLIFAIGKRLRKEKDEDKITRLKIIREEMKSLKNALE